MSLRLIYRLLALLLLAGATMFAAGRSWVQQDPAPQVSDAFRVLADLADATRGAVLTVGGPAVEYALPASADAVRILTNANLAQIDAAREQRRADPDQRWQYAIEVEELDAGGNTLQRRVHHYRRDLVELALPGGSSGTGSFYLERTAPAPLAAANSRMRFDGSSRPERLKLKLVSADPGIADVLVRLAVPVPVSQTKAESMWKRLSDTQREKLASGNVYPPTLLTEVERASLMESRWQPIGPTGPSSGRDIYVLRGYDLGAPVDATKPGATMAGPGRFVTVQLPENGGNLRVVLETQDDQDDQSDQNEVPAQLTLRWSGHSAFLHRESTHQWNGGRFELQDKFGGGWLEIGANRLANVRVELIQDGRDIDITPPIQHLRAWAARDDAPLEFSLSHAGEMPTPLRLVLRRIGSGGKRPANTPVTVKFLAADGANLHTIELAPQLLVSQYDAPWPEVAGEVVSDPWEVFFNVPAHAKKVRIVSPELALVSAYVRPADLPRSIRMPEDVRAPEATQTAIPGWFELNPDEHEARILGGNSNLLAVRNRPPEDRPELSAGHYQWEDFDPVDGGAARVFLAPREDGVPDRRDAIGHTFKPVPEDGRARFSAEPGRSSVAPRLAWAGAPAGAFRYKVLLNGEEWLTGAAEASAGEVVLPQFGPGAHHVKVLSKSKARWYASHLEDGTPWVRRRAYRFDKAMRFDIERSSSDAEFVSVRLFRPAHADSSVDSRVMLRVKIDAPHLSDKIGPYPAWLFTERVYDVRPSGELALPVAETNGEKTDAGQSLFIPIPKGAPHGRYRITLTPQDARGWIAVSRVMPGVAAKPTLILESVRDAE